jgi:hypothetical protein
VFGCRTAGKGAVVDARADDIDAYMEFADAKGLRLTYVIDTTSLPTTNLEVASSHVASAHRTARQILVAIPQQQCDHAFGK